MNPSRWTVTKEDLPGDTIRLRFRLDSRPKYYRHAPYTVPPSATV